MQLRTIFCRAELQRIDEEGGDRARKCLPTGWQLNASREFRGRAVPIYAVAI
jgi:hypothetical protein